MINLIKFSLWLDGLFMQEPIKSMANMIRKDWRKLKFESDHVYDSWRQSVTLPCGERFQVYTERYRGEPECYWQYSNNLEWMTHKERTYLIGLCMCIAEERDERYKKLKGIRTARNHAKQREAYKRKFCK